MDEPDSISNRFAIFMPAVQSLVNAVGGYELVDATDGSDGREMVYRPGDSVLAVLKDLKRLWRKDDSDDERTVARCMAKAGLMKELIALLMECVDRGEWGRKVSLVACDLIAALTWPIDVQAELKEMADEPDAVTDYATLLRAQVEYKAQLLYNDRPLRSLLALILPSLAEQRKTEKDEQVISLGLHIVRNLLSIRDTVAEGTATGEKEELAHLQSTLILQLDALTYFKLFLTVASCADKSDFNNCNVLVLDILHLIFRSVKPKDLIQDQDRAPMHKLANLLDLETRQKSMKSRQGMTRHSRFGTTVAVRAGDQKLVLHRQNAINFDPGSLLDQGKKKRAGKVKKADDLSRFADLSPEALRVLQEFSVSFIESCFNVFFTSILKDIRMERSKIRDTDNTRTFYLSRFFMEYLMLVRDKQAKERETGKGKGRAEDEDEMLLGYAIVMAEMDSVKWVFSRLRTTMEETPPAWTELQACLNCFTQILLLIDAMSTSSDASDAEAAEILQNSIYYNYDILDSALTVMAQYKDQSIAYLDSVVHFAYVLLRMLEKYSKNKGFMYVRKKKARRAVRKRKEDATEAGKEVPEEYVDEEEVAGVMEGDKDLPSYAEHQFTFTAFEQKFAQEGVTNTLLSYLARFKDFDDPDQMKRVVGLMHRQVVKAKGEGLYFKVSTLHLFRRILDVKASLPNSESSRDLTQIITFVLRKFFKRIQEDPFVIVEAIQPKSRGKWQAISGYASDGDAGGGKGGRGGGGKGKKGGMADLEFVKNKKLSWGDQMSVIVSMLVENGDEQLVEWVIDVISVALAAREEIVLSTDGEPLRPTEMEDDPDAVRKFGGPSEEALEKFTRHDLDADTDERKAAVLSNAQFRLMLKLVSFEMTDEENIVDQKWFIPASIPPSNLSASKGALEQYLNAPPSLEIDPKNVIRRVRKRRARAADEDEDDVDSDGNARPRKPKPARKRKQAETQIYKSAAMIEDSDDDEAADAAFFQKEKELRAEMEALASKHGGGGGAMLKTGTKKRKRKEQGKGKGKKKGKKEPVEEEDEDEVREESPQTRRAASAVASESDDGSTEPVARKRKSSEAAPSSSPGPAPSSDEEAQSPAKTQVRTNGKSKRFVESEDESS
ncbi:topoisomerase 1-associated factor 1 [Dioszegia hungarica]|uniref:Topoisomerase 1-associated factor 1 n=1 Tax=Dioszegia hungarica TaxID=4972 RepID=A0AA38HD72_9TREE|nr:topoisomerase 1-associated factor 1 [Dioszegia hungarica]KAI9636791.1 topoisomerase 1-associated factor 1 [Dioszegia hungarica]